VTIQSATMAALPNTPSKMSRCDGEATTSAAQSSWATPIAAKNTPKAHHSSRWSAMTAQ
jgi:hypothetical protein